MIDFLMFGQAHDPLVGDGGVGPKDVPHDAVVVVAFDPPQGIGAIEDRIVFAQFQIDVDGCFFPFFGGRFFGRGFLEFFFLGGGGGLGFGGGSGGGG